MAFLVYNENALNGDICPACRLLALLKVAINCSDHSHMKANGHGAPYAREPAVLSLCNVVTCRLTAQKF